MRGPNMASRLAPGHPFLVKRRLDSGSMTQRGRPMRGSKAYPGAALPIKGSSALHYQLRGSVALDPGRCAPKAQAAVAANEIRSQLITPARRQFRHVQLGRQTSHNAQGL